MNVLICNKSYILKLITFYACIPHLHKLYIQECLILFYFFSDILWFDLFKQNVNVHFSCQENKIFNHIIVFNIIIQSYILSYHLHTDNARLYFSVPFQYNLQPGVFRLEVAGSTHDCVIPKE